MIREFANHRTLLRRKYAPPAGQLQVIYSNANWANGHMRRIGHMFAEEHPDLPTIRKEALDGARDSASCARQLSLAHSEIKGIQESLFNDSRETLPDITSDDVKDAQRRINEMNNTGAQAMAQKAP